MILDYILNQNIVVMERESFVKSQEEVLLIKSTKEKHMIKNF